MHCELCGEKEASVARMSPRNRIGFCQLVQAGLPACHGLHQLPPAFVLSFPDGTCDCESPYFQIYVGGIAVHFAASQIISRDR